MKFFKWRIFIITSVACLLPILFGISMWNKLPDTMAIHFDVYGIPDNYASKGFVIFVLPVLMVVLQAFCCLINDLNAYRKGERKKIELITKWIIPYLTIVLQITTIGYGLGWNFDIRRVGAFIIGVMFLVLGNYMPKFDRIKNYDIDAEKARKINRFIGYETVIMGFLFLGTLFLPPVSTVICIGLLIPYAVIGTVYGIITGRK